jgi:transposase-like protein
MYLYRAVDERGRTVESHLSRTRDIAAARAFFRKALKRHGQPRTITLDGFEPSHAALRRMGMRNEFNYRWALVKLSRDRPIGCRWSIITVSLSDRKNGPLTN